MKLIYPIIILFLLISASDAQLAPYKERFDVVLHPGDLEERTLKVANGGDSPIFKITKTQMSGTAREFIFLDVPEGKPLMPEDKAEIKIYFALPPETKPGSYTGFIYLLDSAPPSLPLRIDFDLDVIGQESYGVDMTIEDAKSATLFAKSDDIAQFDLAVKNLGSFRDVASIDTGPLPEGWAATLMDGEKPLTLPYDLPLDPGTTHSMKLQLQTTKPGKAGSLMVTATSLGNRSENSSIEADVEFGMAVRGYNTDVDIPDKMVANKSYEGSFSIILDVKENVFIAMESPPELMVIPLAQMVEVTPKEPGVANFTMLASSSGEYPLTFKLTDSHGIPMPEETTSIKVVLPQGMAVLTGEDFIYSTVASLSLSGNKTPDILTMPPGNISKEHQERLQGYSTVLILGNRSIVSKDAEKILGDIVVKRIEGDSLYEECWLFAEDIWQNGTAEVVLTGTRPADIFRSYEVARLGGMPMIVCQGNVTEAASFAIKEMTKRNTTLSNALIVGKVGVEYTKSLQDAGVSIEEVTA
jgi:putative cell wall-binding protein